MYLREVSGRSVFQGDLFDDVPFTKVGQGNNTEAPPAWSFSRLTVATLLYPCDMVAQDNVTLIRQQPVALVYDAREKGLTIPADWEGVMGVCPLPDLRGDGRMWVADFRRVSVVDRAYLRDDQRVRCLSEFGWAVYRQRFAGAFTRVLPTVDDILDFGKAAWAESTMEARWVNTGRDRRAFQEWLDAPNESLPYETPRRGLDARGIGLVRTALDYELSGDG